MTPIETHRCRSGRSRYACVRPITGAETPAFANHIGTSRQTVHAIIAGRSAAREEMAVRLARAFNTTPQFWLNLQSNHVVWELERLHRLDRIRPLKKRGPAKSRPLKAIEGSSV